MAKSKNEYLISYKSLQDKLRNEPITNNIFLALTESVLLDEILDIICPAFGGENFDSKNNLISFNAEDKNNEGLLNECSNVSLFADKKVIVLRNVNKLLKASKLALLDYLSRPNPDSCLVMVNSTDELALEKIFLFESKEDPEIAKRNKKIFESNVRVFHVNEFSEADVAEWVKTKFGDYKISNDTLNQFLQLSNHSLDEILPEIDKLKTYTYDTREITLDSVNLCNGIAKDFNEMDFIKAIVERKNEIALQIYSQISLKKDVEVFLVFLLGSAFVIISKLFDPNVSKLHDFMLRKELKLWFEDQQKLLPYYMKYKNSISPSKLREGFDFIFETDKSLKTSGWDKRTIMTTLINNICKL